MPGCGPAYEAADVEDSAYPDGKTADKAIEELDRQTGNVKARELYDHEKSAIAGRNLADDPAYQADAARLSDLLDKGLGWKRSSID